MDFGEILYFIIGIAWVLYSIGRKKKAKKPHENDFIKKEGTETGERIEPGEQKTENAIWEPDISEAENTPSFSSEPVNPIPETKPFQFTKDNPPSQGKTDGLKLDKVPDDYFEKVKMGGSVTRSTKKKHRPKPTTLEQEEDLTSENFDLRQAVINAEILRNPYL